MNDLNLMNMWKHFKMFFISGEEKNMFHTACLPIAKIRTKSLLQLVGPRKPPPQLALLAKALGLMMGLKPIKVFSTFRFIHTYCV